MYTLTFSVDEIIAEEFLDGDQDGMYLEWEEIDTLEIGKVEIQVKEENDNADSSVLLSEVEKTFDLPNGSYITSNDGGSTYNIFDSNRKPLFRLNIT